MFSSTKFVSKENEDDRGWVSINDLNQRKTFVEKPDGGLFEKRVKFLNKSILDTTFLKIRTAGLKNSTEWTIRFFVGSPQERWLKIYVNDREPLADRSNEQNAYNGDFWKEGDPLQKASARVFKRKSLEKLDDEFSEFLRGSRTFELSDAVEYSKQNYIAASSNKAAILTLNSESMGTRFERLILLQALALAYRDVVDDLVFRQTKAVLASTDSKKSVADLEILRDEIVLFEAAFVFKTPLNDDTHHEVSAFWKQCEQALGVNARIEELTTQNRSVYELLRAKEDRKTEKSRQLEIEAKEKLITLAEKTRQSEIEAKEKRIAIAEVEESRRKSRTAFYGVMIALVGILVTVIEPALSWSQIVGAIADFTNTLIEKS